MRKTYKVNGKKVALKNIMNESYIEDFIQFQNVTYKLAKQAKKEGEKEFIYKEGMFEVEYKF